MPIHWPDLMVKTWYVAGLFTVIDVLHILKDSLTVVATFHA
jgi:hypothetical protein